jgi:protease-4
MAIGRAIGGVLSFIWSVLDRLRKVLHLILLLILFAALIVALRGSIPIVPSSAALLLNPQGRIVEQLSGDPLARALGRTTSDKEPETQLRDVLDALTAAAKDERIKLIVLDLDDMQGADMAKLQEIGAALDVFKDSGKKIIAIGDSFDQPQYYLAAHASEIYLDPLGEVFLDGFEYYRMYLKETLDKLAVDINVFKVGTYKSYTENLTRTDMSPAEREESTAWLGALWNAYRADVSQARGLKPDVVSTYIDQAASLMKSARGDAAQVALKQGLVTALKSRRQVGEDLKNVVGEDKDTHLFRAIELQEYAAAVRAEKALTRESKNEIGVIVAAGDILDGRQPPGTVGGESTVEIIRDARYDKDVKAVVLRVDSPGGSMFASEQIYRELKALRESGKPVVVSMSGLAASGGYYIATGGDEIWANPTTLTGSIGVFAAIPTFQRTLEKIGVRVDGVGTTPLSGEFRLDRPLGKQAREILQSGVEHAYDEFLERVAESRRQSSQQIDKIAQGRVWAGTDAKANGLVDSLGNLQDAIKAAARRAKLDHYKVQYLEPTLTWKAELAMEFKSALRSMAKAVGFEIAESSGVRRVFDPLEREVQRWARFNDPRNQYSYCFCSAP